MQCKTRLLLNLPWAVHLRHCTKTHIKSFPRNHKQNSPGKCSEKVKLAQNASVSKSNKKNQTDFSKAAFPARNTDEMCLQHPWEYFPQWDYRLDHTSSKSIYQAHYLHWVQGQTRSALFNKILKTICYSGGCAKLSYSGSPGSSFNPSPLVALSAGQT